MSRRVSWRRKLGSLVTLGLLTAACGSNPSSPSTPTVTDTLTGTLSPSNLNAHPFNVSAAGNVTITLTTLTPPVTAVGIGLGSVSNNQCQNVQSYPNGPFTQGLAWTLAVSSSGTYCVAIYDIGYLIQNENYTITVVHP